MLIKNFNLFFLIITILTSCNQNSDIKLDLPLNIFSTDTTFLSVDYLQYQNAKFHVTEKQNYLVIHQNRKLWWHDFNSKVLTNSIDLDTMSLVIPEVTLLHAKYLEVDSTLVLFFPQKQKIIALDSKYEILKEIELKGHSELDLIFSSKGDHFFILTSFNSVFIGMMSIQSNDQDIFLNETRFIAEFSLRTGELINTFGEFGDKRKKFKDKVMTEGIVLIDYHDPFFFFREVAGDPTISSYNLTGERQSEYSIGTGKISYELYPLLDGDFFNSQSSDQFYSMKFISKGLVVSNTFSRKRIDVQFQFESYLVLEDLGEGKSYSTEIPAFQKIVYATESEIYLVSNHPTKEDLILVRLEYGLGTDQ